MEPEAAAPSWSITAAVQDTYIPNVETVSHEIPVHVHLGGKAHVEALPAPRFSQPLPQLRAARVKGEKKDADGPVPPQPKRVARQRSRGSMTKPASMPNLVVSRKSCNLSEVPGYKRSLTLMRGSCGPLVESKPLVRPRLDPCSHLPRSFPLPLKTATATGTLMPMAETTAMNVPLARNLRERSSLGASEGGMLVVDKKSLGPLPAHTAARRHWQLVRKHLMVTADQKVELLKGTGFLNSLSRSDLIRLARTMCLVLLGKTRRLVRQYENPTFFAIVLRGTLEVRDVNAGIMTLREGECLGVEALGAHHGGAIPSLRTIITNTPVLLLVHQPSAHVRSSVGYVPGTQVLEVKKAMRSVGDFIDSAWVDRVLMELRPVIQTHLIATLVLRMRQFFHLRFSLQLRLRLASLLSIELIPEGTAFIRQGQPPEEVSTYFLLHGFFNVFIADSLQDSGQMNVGQISFRELRAHVGDLSTFSGMPASATVVSQGKCICLVLRREQAEEFAELLPDFKNNANTMANELRRLRSDNGWLGFQDAPEVRSNVEASKLKVSRLLAVERAKMQAAYEARMASLLPPTSLPSLLRFKDPPLDEHFAAPRGSDEQSEEQVPAEMAQLSDLLSSRKGAQRRLSFRPDDDDSFLAGERAQAAIRTRLEFGRDVLGAVSQVAVKFPALAKA